MFYSLAGLADDAVDILTSTVYGMTRIYTLTAYLGVFQSTFQSKNLDFLLIGYTILSCHDGVVLRLICLWDSHGNVMGL